MGNRVVLSIAAAVLTVTVSVAAFYIVLFSWVELCDGDGGDPYSARDSTAGRFCESSGSDAYFWVMFVLPIAAMLVLGIVAVAQRKASRLWMGVAGAFFLVVVLVVILDALPDRCSAEQERNGADCGTY